MIRFECTSSALQLTREDLTVEVHLAGNGSTSSLWTKIYIKCKFILIVNSEGKLRYLNEKLVHLTRYHHYDLTRQCKSYVIIERKGTKLSKIVVSFWEIKFERRSIITFAAICRSFIKDYNHSITNRF